MAIMSDLKRGDVVKSMSLVETIGAGIIGGVGNGIATATLSNFPAWVKPVAEVAAGLIVGNVVKGNVGNMIQSGLVISGMASVSDFIVSAGKSLIAGKQQTTATASNASNMY